MVDTYKHTECMSGTHTDNSDAGSTPPYQSEHETDEAEVKDTEESKKKTRRRSKKAHSQTQAEPGTLCQTRLEIESNARSIANLESTFMERQMETDKKFDQLVQMLNLKRDPMIEALEQRIESMLQKMQSKDELIHDQQVTIEQQKGDIKALNYKLKCKEELRRVEDNMVSLINDAETRCMNKIKEEKRCVTDDHKEIALKITNIEKEIQKKTSQSDHDKLRDELKKIGTSYQKFSSIITPQRVTIPHTTIPHTNTTNTTPLNTHREQIEEEHPDVEEDTNRDDMELRSEIETNEGNETYQQPARYRENNKNHHIPQKVDAEVVLLMDSNNKWIRPDRFWRGNGKAIVITTYTTKELLEHVQYYDLSRANHIIISTGTNDIDYDKGDAVALKIIEGANMVKERNNQAHVYVNQLPPRKHRYEKETEIMNTTLRERMPDTINFIPQENILKQHMNDDKHVHQNCVKLMTGNMKDRMREVTSTGKGQQNNSTRWNERRRLETRDRRPVLMDQQQNRPYNSHHYQKSNFRQTQNKSYEQHNQKNYARESLYGKHDGVQQQHNTRGFHSSAQSPPSYAPNNKEDIMLPEFISRLASSVQSNSAMMKNMMYMMNMHGQPGEEIRSMNG